MMADLMRSEWIKLRTVRVHFVLAIIAVAFPVLVVGLTALFVAKPLEVSDELGEYVAGTMIITTMLAGVISALNLTGEFANGTIRATFAAAPQRSLVLLAKAAVTAITTVVVTTVVMLLTFALGSAILNARDASVETGGGQRLALIGVVVLALLVALFGFGLGLLIRNSPATVAVLILWPLLLESLLRGLLTAIGLDDPSPWLPYQSAFQLVSATIGSEDPSRMHGALYFGGVVVALLGIGIAVNNRRDA